MCHGWPWLSFSLLTGNINSDATIATGCMATVVVNATAIATASCCCFHNLASPGWCLLLGVMTAAAANVISDAAWSCPLVLLSLSSAILPLPSAVFFVLQLLSLLPALLPSPLLVDCCIFIVFHCCSFFVCCCYHCYCYCCIVVIVMMCCCCFCCAACCSSSNVHLYKLFCVQDTLSYKSAQMPHKQTLYSKIFYSLVFSSLKLFSHWIVGSICWGIFMQEIIWCKYIWRRCKNASEWET